MPVFSLDEVEFSPVERLQTGIAELDWIYGYSNDSNVWGMPKGKITLLSGQSGVGKTRLLVEMMKSINGKGFPVLFQQGELPVDQFVAEKLRGYTSPNRNFYLTGDVTLEDQLAAIRDTAPAVAIIDSAQQIEEWRSGRGSKEIVRALRDVIDVTGTHVILISQENADGTTKGGTEIGHEIDIVLRATKLSPKDGTFSLTSGKNRYGQGDKHMNWRHEEHGVVPYSKMRLLDKKYFHNRASYDKTTWDLTDPSERALAATVAPEVVKEFGEKYDSAFKEAKEKAEGRKGFWKTFGGHLRDNLRSGSMM